MTEEEFLNFYCFFDSEKEKKEKTNKLVSLYCNETLPDTLESLLTYYHKIDQIINK
jgi:hypothetical protein